jgi:purine-binding chemotaxis protein CheW
MERLMLIVRIADEIVALPADRVESVVEIDALTAIPLAPPHIAGLAALRSRVVTVVDPAAVLGLAATWAMPFAAVVVPVDGHCYGIIVDEVLDVTEAAGPPSALQGRVGPGWGAVARGTVIVGDRQHLLIDADALIAGSDGAAAGPAAAAHEGR